MFSPGDMELEATLDQQLYHHGDTVSVNIRLLKFILRQGRPRRQDRQTLAWILRNNVRSVKKDTKCSSVFTVC